MSKKNKKKFSPEMAKSGRPVTAAVAIRDVNDKYSSYPSDGLTPVKLARIFKEADAGDLFRQMELFEEMESKDTHLFSQLQTRKLAVTGLDWEVQPFSQDEADQQVATFVEEQLKELDGFSDNIMDILDAIGKGISFQEIGWDYREGRVVVDNIEYVHQKKFYYDSMTDELIIRTDDYPGGIPLPDNKFIIHKYKARSGHPSKYGVLRVVAWMYLFKNYDVKDWVSFCEVYGLRLGTYDATASEKDKTALMDAIVKMGTDAAGIVPSGTDIKFIESNKQSSVDIYEKLARYCDEQMSKAIVGQTLTSDSGGSYAQSRTHNDVRQDLTEADCKAVMETIRRDLIRPLVEFNFGIQAHVPYFVLNATDTDDLKETAEIISTLAATGLEIPKPWLYKKFNIPSPEEGEETIGKAMTVQPGQPVGDESFPGWPMKQMRLKADARGADGQKVLDGLEEAAASQSKEFLHQMFAPVLDMVDNCSSLEDLQASLQDEKSLKKLYDAMNVKDFDRLVEKVMYVSNMLGRMQDG